MPDDQPTNETVLRGGADGVLTLTLNRPEALNAFTVEMKEALLAALRTRQRASQFASSC